VGESRKLRGYWDTGQWYIIVAMSNDGASTALPAVY
jgi:hypothetical protein